MTALCAVTVRGPSTGSDHREDACPPHRHPGGARRRARDIPGRARLLHGGLPAPITSRSTPVSACPARSCSSITAAARAASSAACTSSGIRPWASSCAWHAARPSSWPWTSAPARPRWAATNRRRQRREPPPAVGTGLLRARLLRAFRRRGRRVPHDGHLRAARRIRIAWNDPDIGIDWPIREPLVSQKDANAQSLAEWLARPEAQHFRYQG